MPSSALHPRPLHSFPTRRSSDLTTTKPSHYRPDPSILTWWSAVFEIPCVAIGGITPENAKPLVDAGADFLAVCQAVWGKDDPAASDRKSTRLNSSHSSISYAVFCSPPPPSTLFPYTTLFRSDHDQALSLPSRPVDPDVVVGCLRNSLRRDRRNHSGECEAAGRRRCRFPRGVPGGVGQGRSGRLRSEEHTSELQSQFHLVCRLLLSTPALYTLSLHDALPI